MLTKSDKMTPRLAEQRDERLFVLRPYVFAAQQYELCYAPWTLQNLPLERSISSIPSTPVDEEMNPYEADLKPRSRELVVDWYGQTISLSTPILSHAAMLWFFSNTPKEGDEEEVLDGPMAPFMAVATAAAGINMAVVGGDVMVGRTPVIADDDDAMVCPLCWMRN